MQKPIFLADLDGFLFELLHKCKNPAKLVAGNMGREPSFMNETQLRFFQWLCSSARLVPVTGRNVESFRSIDLTWEEPAIVSFGGAIVLPNGELDQRWLEIIRKDATSLSPEFERLLANASMTAEQLGLDLRAERIADEGVDQYIKVVPVASRPRPELVQYETLAAALGQKMPPSWQMHANKNQLSLMPPYLRKVRAVQYFMENLAGEYSFVLGGGDSLSDLSFMKLASFAMLPTESQAFEALVQAEK